MQIELNCAAWWRVTASIQRESQTPTSTTLETSKRRKDEAEEGGARSPAAEPCLQAAAAVNGSDMTRTGRGTACCAWTGPSCHRLDPPSHSPCMQAAAAQRHRHERRWGEGPRSRGWTLVVAVLTRLPTLHACRQLRPSTARTSTKTGRATTLCAWTSTRVRKTPGSPKP